VHSDRVPAPLPRWLIRPGLGVSLLEGLAFWPLWVLLATVALLPLQMAPTYGVGHFVLFAVLSISVLGLASHVTASSRGLVAMGARDPIFWWGATVLLGVMTAGLRFRWGVVQEVVLLVGASAAALTAIWVGALGLLVRRWPTGRLRVNGDDVRLECAEVVFVLERAPKGARSGEMLTLPRVELEHAGSGPYRSGRGVGHAPIVLRADGRRLARALFGRAMAMAVWSAVTITHLALG